MRFVNTSRYDGTRAEELVAFAMSGLDHSSLAVHLRNSSRPYRGRAYDGIPEISSRRGEAGVTRLVTLGLGAPGAFPCTNAITSVRWLQLPPDIDASTLPRGDVRRARSPRSRSGYERRVVRTHGYGGVRSPVLEFRTWEEALVAVAAHEGRHIAQYQLGLPRSEVDAEHHAARRLDLFRTRLQQSTRPA